MFRRAIGATTAAGESASVALENDDGGGGDGLAACDDDCSTNGWGFVLIVRRLDLKLGRRCRCNGLVQLISCYF